MVDNFDISYYNVNALGMERQCHAYIILHFVLR
jgi:hypothetical protein